MREQMDPAHLELLARGDQLRRALSDGGWRGGVGSARREIDLEDAPIAHGDGLPVIIIIIILYYYYIIVIIMSPPDVARTRIRHTPRGRWWGGLSGGVAQVLRAVVSAAGFVVVVRVVVLSLSSHRFSM